MKFFANIISFFAWLISRLIQRGLCFILKYKFKHAGTNLRFNPFDYFNYGEIEIGNDVFIAPNAWFAGRKIRIGSHVMFGPGVMIQAGAHNVAEVGWMSQAKELDRSFVKGVVIEDNTWIASNVILIDGARVCEGSVIGAGSVVTGVIPANSIAVGNPARVIRARLTDEQMERHIEFKKNNP